jgi:hypothetical protein
MARSKRFAMAASTCRISICPKRRHSRSLGSVKHGCLPLVQRAWSSVPLWCDVSA